MQSTGRIGQTCGVIWAFILMSYLGIVFAQDLNLWTNTASGKWEEPNWSLGILPGNSQIVEIASPVPATVEIDAATVANYESSLSMGHLVVSNANTLLLNHAGTDKPLHLSPGTN